MKVNAASMEGIAGLIRSFQNKEILEFESMGEMFKRPTPIDVIIDENSCTISRNGEMLIRVSFSEN